MSKPSRHFETTIEIDAPVEDVWRCLTEARELERWFPFEARVDPGAGGSVWLSWGEGMGDTHQVEIWEEKRHLRLAQPESYPWAASEEQRAAVEPVRASTDYYLESRGASTVLRLVYSGFGEGKAWDDEYDNISRGWMIELGSLQHYLRHHHDEDRSGIWAMTATDLDPQEAWQRFLSPRLLLADGDRDAFSVGASIRCRAATGDLFEGTIEFLHPPTGFVMTLDNWNGGRLRWSLDVLGGRTMASVMLYLYDDTEGKAADFKKRWLPLLERELA